MKITLTELDGCFSFNLTAETLPDAALLTRLGMNATSELRYVSATADKGGSFQAGVVIAKHKQANNIIPKRR